MSTKRDDFTDHRHTITLRGSQAHGARLPLRVLSAVGRVFDDAARRVLRLSVDGRSHLIHAPDWLEAAADMSLVGLQTGSTQLLIDAAPLSQSAPAIFDQLSFWEPDFSREDTPFSLLEATLRDALSGNADSSRLDRNILSAVIEFRSLLEMGFESITLNGGPEAAVEISAQGLAVVEGLQKEAPQEAKVVISGVLDSLRHRRKSFDLLVRGGRVVRGILPQEDPAIAALWGRQVVIDGEAVFKPSGELSLIRATRIAPAREEDTFWEQVPRARPRSVAEIEPRIPVVGGGNGLARVFGQWPGEESEEEILQMLDWVEG